MRLQAPADSSFEIEPLRIQNVAKEVKCSRVRRLDTTELIPSPEGPAYAGTNLVEGDSRIDCCQDELTGLVIGLEHALVADHFYGAGAGHAQLLPGAAARAMPRAGDEIHRLREGPGIQPTDDDRSLSVNGDLSRTAAARQANGRPLVRADDRSVDISPTIDLRAAQETHFDQAVLQNALEHIGHAADHQRSSHQRGITDGNRKSLGYRAYRPGFVDEHEVGGVRSSCEVTCKIGQPDADEHHLPVRELAGGHGGHDFAGGVSSHG